jgi:hypothetical protein
VICLETRWIPPRLLDEGILSKQCRREQEIRAKEHQK